MSSRKIWVAGDEVLATDLNGNFKFGGDGSDGALTVASGVTNINLGGVAVVYLNYTSISITGTGQVTFSNPHANGTIIIIRVQGNVTLTSSTIPNMDVSGMGATAGTGGAVSSSGSNQTNNAGVDATSPVTNYQDSTSASQGKGASGSSVNGGTAPSAFTNQYVYTLNTTALTNRKITVAPGNGGGGGGGGQSQLGSGTAGASGGRGGGALIIECAGALNFTSTLGINVSGLNGSNAGNTSNGSGLQSGAGGGGGGGSAGMCLILYNTLTSASGTVNAKGGNGGNGGNAVATGTGGGSASGTGGGGSGGASLVNAGGSGGNGAAIGGNNNGNAGNAGTAGSGGGGGGGACVGSGTAASTTGGTGGTGGSTSTSLWLVAKNLFFA